MTNNSKDAAQSRTVEPPDALLDKISPDSEEVVINEAFPDVTVALDDE